MKRKIQAPSLLSVCLLAAAATLPAADTATPEADVLAGQAKASVAAFAGALKSELMAAMKAGGPVQAIDVCHSAAPTFCASIAETAMPTANAGIWTGVCGEMAGDLRLTPLLLGLGVEELSVGPHQVPRVRRVPAQPQRGGVKPGLKLPCLCGQLTRTWRAKRTL